MPRYIISVRRENRTTAPADWQQQLAALEGVSVDRSSGGQRGALADFDESLLPTVSSALPFCNVEEQQRLGRDGYGAAVLM